MKFNMVEPTPEQAKLWAEVRVALSWHVPAFTHIFMTMMNSGNKHIAYFTRDVPIAATDGDVMFINPDTFFSKDPEFNYNIQNRLFIACHEILHAVFNHLVMLRRWRKNQRVDYANGQSLPYNEQIMQWALDFMINDTLVDAKVGEFRKGWLHDPSLITKADDAATAYWKLFKKLGGQSGQGPGPGYGTPTGAGKDGTFDQHIDPGASQGKNPDQAVKDRNDAKWGIELNAAYNLQRLQGNKALGLERLFKEVLTPKVDWRDKIKAMMARRLGSDRYDFKRPDRRLISRNKPYEPIFAPSRSGYGTGTVVVGVDTSGSITQKEIDMFLGELSGILQDVKPKRLIIAWCDAHVHNVDECEQVGDLETIRRRGVGGGGGTNFIPVFEYVDKEGLEPEAIVYLTDGEGSFPERAPHCPVVWGYLPANWRDKENRVKFPFGDVCEIPRQS